MATSSFDTDFVVEDPKAVKNLGKAAENAKKYTPKNNFNETVNEGIKTLKQSLSHSK